ncbi:hypothetical protein QS257_17795 [Terrilactibacillus sp. S3-3]|nr:hypothetical protein QS257_17795 [Terrilactibacillus sp. S3-3]
MLAESIIRVGRPIVQGNLPNEERIRWLTDVAEENCKNFFKHIFAVEIDKERSAYHFLKMTGQEKQGSRRNSAFPILYPNGGNPLVAQGIYPVPCYLVYDKHIKAMNQPDNFAEKVILPRLKNTVPYKGYSDDELHQVAGRIAAELNAHYDEFLSSEKQLGILYIIDHRLSTFRIMKELEPSKQHYLWIVESSLQPNRNVCLDEDKALEDIVESRFIEAKSLGYAKNAISTLTNQREEVVVSIYNKSWLWMSPTWEMPRSIYWNKDEWTKGIKIDKKKNYEAFLYGAQFF